MYAKSHTEDLSNSYEDSAHPNQTFVVRFKVSRVANTSTVNSTDESQLKTCDVMTKH